MSEVVAVWSAERVLALTPDVNTHRAARGLTGDRRWVESGFDGDHLLWGRCRGSAAVPYQVLADIPCRPMPSGRQTTSDPVGYRCTCPSRKSPCKHALALLLRWADGSVAVGGPPGWAAEWEADRAARAERAARRSAAGDQPRQANPKTAERRAERVASGLGELDRWLADQVAAGVAGLTTAGYEPFDNLAARLVDAQAPGAAGLVRRLAGVAVSGQPDRLLTELGLLRLLASGFARRAELPEALAATVAMRVGLTVGQAEVLARPPVTDAWVVVGVREEEDERGLVSRRVWLVGSGTARPAMVLSFAGPGMTLPTDFVLGETVDADLCFYPGAALRALVSRRGSRVVMAEPPGGSVAAALDSWAAALAGDPWLDRWPVVLDAVVPTMSHLVEPGGDAVALLGGGSWPLVAAAGGRPVRVAGEYGPAGLRPLAAWVSGRVVPL